MAATQPTPTAPLIMANMPKQEQSNQHDIEAQSRHSSSATETPGLTAVVTDSEGASRPVVLDWDSPEDPDNPHLWPQWKKVFNVTTPAIFCFILAAGSSTYVPAIAHIQEIYHVKRVVATLPLSLYVFGFCIGPIFSAPLSELYGRRNVYWVSLPAYIIFTAIAGAANNVPLLIIARFLASAGGSAPFAIAAGTITDVYEDKGAQGRAALFLTIAPFLGPALGSLIGAYMIDQYDNDWRYSLWVILMICAPVVVMTVFIQETSKTRILYLRERKRGTKVEFPKEDTKTLVKKIGRAFLRPLQMVLYEPLVATNSLYTGFSFGMLYSFFASYNYVFRVLYHFNAKEIGLTFIGMLVGFLLGPVIFGVFDKIKYQKLVAAGIEPVPEARLYAAMAGSIFIPIGLFWFAWAPQPGVHWIVPTLAGVPFGMGSVATFLGATLYQIDVYGTALGSSTMAANGIIRYTLGAAFPLFTIPMYQNLGVHWGGSVFAFIGLALMPVPFLFFKWGHLLRERSIFVHDESRRTALR